MEATKIKKLNDLLDIKNIARSFLIACSFFTILPVPGKKGGGEWGEDAMRYFGLMMPVIGFIIGAFWAIFFILIFKLNFTPLLKSVLMTFAVLIITGGMHMDGFMDACDAIFSRRDRETRLKILHDTHTGAFAVMGCVFIIILQTALFNEIFLKISALNNNLIFALISTPLYSRLGMAIYFNSMNYAKQGITTSLGALRERRHTIYLIILAILIAIFNIYIKILYMPLAWLAIFFAWQYLCFSMFGGITGDLLGAFAEICETLLIAVIILCI